MAAMLAWQVGDDKVVTVEVDKDLATTARGNLDRVEKQPEVVTGIRELSHCAHDSSQHAYRPSACDTRGLRFWRAPPV
ncbi:hypothetical protein [Actinomadura litoris]|uniref:hypothetical protein n=1 Tax=Actinomadura litoris TaxID=2678616 RepID=UPI001FA7F5C7|nr:hypothetical protein [Actinomadura litoris]